MSFSSTIKTEVALLNDEYEKDTIAALLRCAGNIQLSNHGLAIEFKSENSKITQKVFKYISKTYQIPIKSAIVKNMKLLKKTQYIIIIREKANQIIHDLGIMDETEYIKEVSKSKPRVQAYLAGLFLGCGSVNDLKVSYYHLEFCVLNLDFAKEIVKLLAKIDIPAKIVTRRAQQVVYVKKSDKIGDFLSNIKAVQSYLQFEDVRAYKDVKNNLNRITNCDMANYIRTTNSAKVQLEYIKIIEEKANLSVLDNDLQILCNLRKEYQDISLKELAVKYSEVTSKPISKSGINHLFIKIKKYAELLKSGDING